MKQPISRLSHSIQSSDVPTATLLIGAPGSGKSSWLAKYGDFLAIPISSDMILDLIAAEENISYEEAFQRHFLYAQELMYVTLDEAIAKNLSVVVDRTNMSVTARAKILAHIPPHYRCFAAVFKIDRQELDRRLINRRAETGKWIAPDAIDTMLESYEEPTSAEFEMIFV